jgi:formylglycine-generating enzyme required for sulfatase activity
MVNCKNCSDIPAVDQPVKVGSLKPNPFGLFDMGGAVDQWVEDCWHKNYQGAPTDGSAWVENGCPAHVIRSGSWRKDSNYARSSNRSSYDTNVRYPTHGFRVALSP